PGRWRSVPAMPELLEPADPRGGDREVVVRGPWSVVSEGRATPVPPPSAPTAPPAPSSRTTDHGPRTTAPVLLFDRVSKWYGPVIGVNRLTLDMRPGITGRVGCKGAGKSRLLLLAGGQLRPSLGTVQVCGHEAWTAAAKRHIGYCPEFDTFYEEMSGR